MPELSHSDEREMYSRDHAEWCLHVAPKWLEIMKSATEERKREMWGHAKPALRAEIRRLAKT